MIGQWTKPLRRLSFELCSTLKEYEASGDDQAVLDVLNGLRIVSLNYDRSFAYYFFPPIVQFFHKAKLSDPDFLRTKQNDLVGFFRTYQPHGSLGFLAVEDMARTGNPISALTVVDGNKYSNFIPNSNGTEYGGDHSVHNHIELVGESDMKGNYKTLNQEVLAGCKYCLVIGLSDIGIEGCGIDWSTFDTVFYSGATLPPGINGNFECLNMYADEIAKNLCSQKTLTSNEWIRRIIHHAS